MGDFFICPICGNSNPKYIGYRNGKPYCRKCLQFKGNDADDSFVYPKKAFSYLEYSLSLDQKDLSNRLVLNYKKGKNSFINAVCGSGKTEIVLSAISCAIECGEKVGFAVPRRDVAVELWERFKKIFRKNKITLVCGGYHEVLEGDLVCLTTHQLFRYEKYFDLLVMDEVDAFPYQGDETLQKFFKRSVKGKYILMSATITPSLRRQILNDGTEVLELSNRFHKHALPVPEIIYGNNLKLYYKCIYYIKKFISNNKQVFIFCPTILVCEFLYKLLSLFVRGGNFVHSKKEGRPSIINDFKNGKYKYLVTTAVLERGVTVKGLQVIVFQADHKIYDPYALIQIAGRAGRKADEPEGKVIFLAHKNSKSIEKCISDVSNANFNM